MASEVNDATDNDTEMHDGSSSDSDSVASNPVETLVAGRNRRSTAGNRLNTLLEKEVPDDDEVKLLFQEEGEEEDVEFEAHEDEASDMMDSSDDEDQGPDAKDDELEGEREIQKEERRAKKRKAQEAFNKIPGMRKKPKIPPTAQSTAPTAPAPRPKKKSERVSWLPTPEDGPVRQSSRRQTVQNKKATHAKMKEDIEKRRRAVAAMEQAAIRKEKHKPKEMTQADRLAEAAKTEKMNSKSLNRWEEMEKKKAEEQRARLAALQDRKLEGPVITLWSGAAKWIGDKLSKVGLCPVTEVVEKDPRGRKKKDKDQTARDQSNKKNKSGSDDKTTQTKEERSQSNGTTSNTTTQPGQVSDTPPITFAPPQGPSNFLDGIHFYAAMPADGEPAVDLGASPAREDQVSHTQLDANIAAQPASENTSKIAELEHDVSVVEQGPMQPPTSEEETKPTSQNMKAGPSPVQQPSVPHPPTDTASQNESKSTSHILEDSTASVPEPAPAQPQYSVRNLVILENFDSKSQQGENSIFFTNRRAAKPQPKSKTTPQQELCVITGYPARYRDPETGLPYYDKYGYGQIQKLKVGHFSWSNMLGSYVGEGGIAARGVPDKFFAPFGAPPGNGPIY